MNIQNRNILSTRIYLKNKILQNNDLRGFENERKQIFDLLQQTVLAGESNSILLIGPRNIGKTLLVKDILKELINSDYFDPNAILVRLHGLVHTDDRLALKSITSQMNLENAVDGKVFGSFAENLSFLLACLRTGQKETAKSVLFVLEEFDLFCAHSNQTLLYNLFDVSQSAQTPICVLGVTSRLDVIELFEKRVKSRFSHRQIFLLPNQYENSEGLEQCLTQIENLLTLPSHSKEYHSSHAAEWNKSINLLLKNKKVKSVIQRSIDIGSFETTFRNIMLLVLAKLNDEKATITPEDFETEWDAYESDDMIRTIKDLSILEICLLIAMKHHVEIYDDQPFNFEIVLTRYTKFINSNSNVQSAQRNVIIKAYEHLQNLELIVPTSAASRLQKEYQLCKLIVSSKQILEAIKNYNGLPTEVVQWAGSSIV